MKVSEIPKDQFAPLHEEWITVQGVDGTWVFSRTVPHGAILAKDPKGIYWMAQPRDILNSFFRGVTGEKDDSKAEPKPTEEVNAKK